MHITNFTLCLILISMFSLPAKTIDIVPDEVLILIFNMLEIKDFSRAASSCKFLLTLAEKTWEIKARSNVPDWYCTRKSDKTSWSKFYDVHTDLRDILVAIFEIAELSKNMNLKKYYCAIHI